MRNPYRSRRIALRFFWSGWVTALAVLFLPSAWAPDWVRVCLFIYGISAILFGGGEALFRHFDVRAKEALACGEDIIARWRVDAAAWREFVAADREWNRTRDALTNELSLPASVPGEGVEVVVGRNAVQIGESIHRLTGGAPEVTDAILHDLRPPVIELRLYYPGGGFGASGIPRPPSRAALRFPVGAGAWKEAGVAVAHYRGDTPRKADFFHGTGDGADPKDLSKCYHCGYEGHRLLSHCPQCGCALQSRRWSRRFGWMLLIVGLLISAAMGAVLYHTAPMLLHPGDASRGTRFSGTLGQARLILSILAAVELFGIAAMCYGLFQVVTGKRSKWVIYLLVGLFVVLGLVALFIQARE